MNKQRFAVIIVAIIGIVATFLPWYRIEQVGTLSGISSSGWFTFYPVYYCYHIGHAEKFAGRYVHGDFLECNLL